MTSFVLLQSALAQNINYEPGRFVYTDPPSFDPPLIGAQGVQQIQEHALKTNYPFVVVLVKQLPSGPSPERRASTYINRLSEEFSKQGLDISQTQFFILSYEPRQYRFIAGQDFETRLGFRNSAHEPYLNFFKASVNGARKTPKEGIINMMKAVDAYLFNNTDPERLKAVQAARARQLAEQRLTDARRQLDSVILSLEKVKDLRGKAFPSKDYPEEAIIAAKKALAGSDLKAIEQHQVLLENRWTPLSSSVSQYINASAWRVFGVAVGISIAFGFLIYLIGTLIGRARRKADGQEDLEFAIDGIRSKIQNAHASLLNIYTERDSIAGLQLEGDSKINYDKILSDLDRIYLGVAAISERIKAIEPLANGSLADVERGLQMLEESFTYKAGPSTQAKLFLPSEVEINSSISELVNTLAEEFDKVVESWQGLKEALTIQNVSPQELFSPRLYDDIITKAKELDVPMGWFKQHPLAGSDAEDASFYEKLSKAMKEDPYKGLAQIEEAKAAHEKEVGVLNRFANLLNHLDQVALTAVVIDHANLVLHPSEDPNVIAHQISSLIQEVRKAIGQIDLDALDKAEEDLDVAFDEYIRLVDQLKQAGSDLEPTLSTLGRKIGQAAALIEQLQTLTAAAQPYHKQLQDFSAASWLDEIDTIVSKEVKINKAAQAHEVVFAYNSALNLLHKVETLTQSVKSQIQVIESLEADRKKYNRLQEQMESEYRSRKEELDRYNSTASLRSWRQEDPQGPYDYSLALIALSSVQSSWEREVDQARHNYETEQSASSWSSSSYSSSSYDSDSDSSSGSGWSSSSSSDSGGGWSSSDGGSSGGDSGGSW